MKKVLLICAIAVAAFALAACSSGSSTTAQSPNVGLWTCTQEDLGMGDEYVVTADDMASLGETPPTLDLKADGSGTLDFSGDSASITWTDTATGIEVSSGSTKIEGTVTDNTLVLDYEGIKLTFTK